MLTQKEPWPITQKAYDADELARREANVFDSRMLRGAPRTPVKFVPPTLFVCDSEGQLMRTFAQLQSVVGPSYRGNKRRGKKKLYGELLAIFKHFEVSGVRLPRGGNISREMIFHGLGQILRDQGCTNLTDDALLKNAMNRKKLGKKMDRIFSQIVLVLDAS